MSTLNALFRFFTGPNIKSVALKFLEPITSFVTNMMQINPKY